MGLERPIILKGKGEEEKKEEPAVVATGGDFTPEKPGIFPEAVPESKVNKNPSGPLESAVDIAMRRSQRPVSPENNFTLDSVLTRIKAKAEQLDSKKEDKKEAGEGDYDHKKSEKGEKPGTLPGQDDPKAWERIKSGPGDDDYESPRMPREPEFYQEAPKTGAGSSDKSGMDDQDQGSEYPRMPREPELELEPTPEPPSPENPPEVPPVVPPTPEVPPIVPPTPETPPVVPPTPEVPPIVPPTPEEQERRKSHLDALREALVRHEQKGGGYEEENWGDELARLTREYDAARSEFIDGDRARFVEEQTKLMQKRSEGVPGRIERVTENADKFLRKTGGYYISSALLGIGAIFPPALLARPFFAAPAALISTYQRMRQYSLHGGLFGAIKGIKNESLKNLGELSKEDIEQRMAMLAGYAKVQGYWGDVRDTYARLNEAYLGKLQTAGNFDMNRYASEQIGESRRKFEERRGVEKGRMWARRLGAIGAGAIAGGLVGWFFGTPDAPTGGKGTGGVPKPAPGGTPGGVPEVAPEGLYPEDTIPAHEVPEPDPNLVQEPELAQEPELLSDEPAPDTLEKPFDAPPPEHSFESAEPAPDTLEKVIDFIPAEHGLSPQYYDLIKGDTVDGFLKRHMFGIWDDTKLPYPAVDNEYSYSPQRMLAQSRGFEYGRFQKKILAALEGLKSDPAAVETARKMIVDDFFKNFMGKWTETGSGITRLD